MLGLAYSLWIYLFRLFVCSIPLLIPFWLLVPYSPFVYLSTIVTTQPNINLSELRLMLDVIIKPNPRHPPHLPHPPHLLIQTTQASYMQD